MRRRRPPYGQQQPYQYNPYAYHSNTPYQPQMPPQRVVKSVQKQRGLSGLTHTTHLLLTVCTCGMWLFVWVGHEIFRLLVARKKVTKHHYR
jgi:hypothetical protein